MEPEADFPAAHSMDTEWYAVDRDGHLAVFASGESGAVPVEAGTNQEITAHPISRIVSNLPAISPVFDLKEWIGHGPTQRHYRAEGLEWWDTIDGIVMFLRTLDPIREYFDPGLILPYPPIFGVAVHFRSLCCDLFRRIHKVQACRACFWKPFNVDLPSRMGLFTYTHTCENWISGPYQRACIPTRPLRLEPLTPDLRRFLERMRFSSLCFAESKQIQPVDHALCQSWENAYLALDGKTIRAIPGREGHAIHRREPVRLE